MALVYYGKEKEGHEEMDEKTKKQIEYLEAYITMWDIANDDDRGFLIDMYAEFVAREDLPSLSADELLHDLQSQREQEQ